MQIGLVPEESFWTLITINGYLKALDKDLLNALLKDEVQGRERTWTKVQGTIISGRICHILLTGTDSSSNEISRVLELSNTGELVKASKLCKL